MSDEAAADDALDDRPDLAEPLEAVLAVDQNHDRWAFDDVPIESGPFGELVSRGVVESAGSKYRLADADAVRAALEGDREKDAETEKPPSATRPTAESLSLPDVDRSTALLVTAAIAVVALIRARPLGSIYRDGAIVLSGNDPYYYRWAVEEAIAEGSVLGGVGSGEPLLVVTLSALGSLLGGSAAAVGHVLAWYPVVAAMLGAVLVYLLAMEVTDDRHIALAAVLFFAVIPGHALRTSVGFADHHAFDYLWLGLTALALAKLATVDRDALRSRRTWTLTVAVGVAVAAQVLAWEGGPLLLAPLALLVPARAVLDVHRNVSPIPAGVPPTAGLGLGALVGIVLHAVTGMQALVVVLTPAVLCAWAALTLGVAVAGRRLDASWSSLLVAYGLLAAIGALALLNGPASIRGELLGRIAALFRGGPIAETQSLLNPEALGGVYQFGLVLILALPTMVAGLARSVEDGRWLVVTTYAWTFLLFTVFQVRFVGELATFVAVFAGSSFVLVAARLGAFASEENDDEGPAPVHIPDRRTLATLIALFVLLGGVGAVQASEKTNQLQVQDRIYDTATFLADHADQQGEPYPENYVLSDWSDNRVYNYAVSGESASYLYAQDNYTEFAGGTDTDSWYDEFDGRVGYVVLAPAQDGVNPRSAIWRLTRNYGSADGDVPGVGHYRPLYVPPDGGRVVVEVVPGATLSGSGPPGESVTVSTTVEDEHVEFSYERHTTVTDGGRWHVRVANSGHYEVSVGNQTTAVDVPERAVLDGENVSAD